MNAPRPSATGPRATSSRSPSARAACPPTAAAAPLILEVAAREPARRIVHAREVLPTKPGPLTLLYPKWTPGEHAPTGPINDPAGVKVTASGKPLPWRRDPENM